MWVWNFNSADEPTLGVGIKTAKIEYSDDDVNAASVSSWKTWDDNVTFADAPGTNGYEPPAQNKISFGPEGIRARLVKITAKTSFIDWGEGLNQFGLSEVRFYSIPAFAQSMTPANLTTGLDPTGATGVPLAWRPGRYAVSHTIQMSTDMNIVYAGSAVFDTTANASYNAMGLQLGVNTTANYYWKVDEVSPAGFTYPVWSLANAQVQRFATADYNAVDDMESYNDVTNAVFKTWKDGYGTTTNGGSVGYPDTTNPGASYMEKTAIHGGTQSVPFFFKNTGTYTFSEIFRAPVVTN